MVEIECLVCSKTIKIPGFIDTNNYDGQIACPECLSLLYVKLVGAKVRKYKVVEKGSKSLSARPKVTVSPGETAPKTRRKAVAKGLDVESVAKYNPLRDFLVSYRATQLLLAFEQIESMIGHKLETAAHTFKSWWENDRKNPQAIAWLEAGWEVVDVNLQQRKVILRRMEQP